MKEPPLLLENKQKLHGLSDNSVSHQEEFKTAAYKINENILFQVLSLEGTQLKFRIYLKKETTEITFPFDIEKDTA